MELLAWSIQGSSVYPSQLSGGMQQRVRCAAAFDPSPEDLAEGWPFGALRRAFTRMENAGSAARHSRKDSGKRDVRTHRISEAIYP